jgi:predicted RNase H-like nuclease (RuvC/YqgF family)
MPDKIDLLAQKITEAGDLIERLKAENSDLKSEVDDLTKELKKLKSEQKRWHLISSDQADAVRTRLTAVLSRLDQLEQMAG